MRRAVSISLALFGTGGLLVCLLLSHLAVHTEPISLNSEGSLWGPKTNGVRRIQFRHRWAGHRLPLSTQLLSKDVLFQDLYTVYTIGYRYHGDRHIHAMRDVLFR